MFCPRCGARHADGVGFCEQCGQRLDEPAPSPPRPPAAALSRRPDRKLLAAGAIVATLVGAGVLLALTGAFDRDGPHARSVSVARRPVQAAVPRTGTASSAAEPSAAVVPETATATPDTEAPTSRSIAAIVARTCGRGGVGGDCHLSVRADPSPDAAEVRRLDEGDTLRLSCQVRGVPVHSSVLGTSSTVWSRTTRGGYVSNVYVAGSQLKARRVTLPPC